MEYWQRRSLAARIAPLVLALMMALVYYASGAPMPRVVKRELLAPFAVGALLLLVFGPVLIGNYLAGRKGKPPLS